MADTVVYQLGVGAAGQQTMIPLRVRDNGDGTFSPAVSGSAGLPASLGQKAASASTSVVLASDGATEAHLGQVGGLMVRVGVSFTRPSNATPYTALDVVNDSASAPTVMTFVNFARVNGGGGAVTKAILVTDLKTDVKRYRLHMFDTAPTVINDNAPFTSLFANNAIRLGYFDFPAMATEDPTNSTAARTQSVGLLLPFVAAVASRSLFGVLETLDAGTPASAQQYWCELTGDVY